MQSRMILFVVSASVVWFSTFFGRVESVAGVIGYSWSGTLEPDSAADPWSLGGTTPFSLDVFLSSTATDMSDQNVSIAVFDVADARLKVGNKTAQFAHDSQDNVLDFTDSSVSQLDIVSFFGNFTLRGEVVEITSAVALPMDTYQFTDVIELPPLFSTTTVENRTGTGIGPYSSVVEAGAPFVVVPEPSAAGLAFFCIVLAARSQMRSCRQWYVDHK